MNDYGGFITGQSGMIYVCGRCAFDQFLTPTDKIECRNCSHKILYKRRGRDAPMYEAR